MIVEILQTISIILLGNALFRLSKSVESLYSICRAPRHKSNKQDEHAFGEGE